MLKIKIMSPSNQKIMNRLTRSLFVFLVLFASQPLYADIYVMPDVSIGYMDYELSRTTIDSKDALPYLRLSMSVLIDRFFINGYAQSSISDGEVAEFFRINRLGLVHEGFLNIEFERQDYSLGLGYAFNDALSVYLGYRMGETTGDTFAIRTFATIFEQATDFFQFTESLKTTGFFLGLNLNYKLPVGRLVFNVALAKLEAKLKQNLYDVVSRDFNEFLFTDNSVGHTVGVSWSTSITQQLNLSLGLDSYSFKYKKLSAEEKIVSTSVRFSYLF